MAKLSIALSIVLIFASMANGILESSEEKIKSIIEGTTLAYNNVKTRAREFPVNLLQKLIPIALNISQGIDADLQNRDNEYKELFSAIPDVTASDCEFPIERLREVASSAFNTLEKCVIEQIAAVKVNVTEIQRKADNELNIIAGYAASPEKCHIDNAGSNFRIRRCLRRVNRELYKLPRVDFTQNMRDLTNWLTNCEVVLDSCTRTAVDAYYAYSYRIIETAGRCIKAERDKKIYLSVATEGLPLTDETTTAA